MFVFLLCCTTRQRFLSMSRGAFCYGSRVAARISLTRFSYVDLFICSTSDSMACLCLEAAWPDLDSPCVVLPCSAWLSLVLLCFTLRAFVRGWLGVLDQVWLACGLHVFASHAVGRFGVSFLVGLAFFMNLLALPSQACLVPSKRFLIFAWLAVLGCALVCLQRPWLSLGFS